MPSKTSKKINTVKQNKTKRTDDEKISINQSFIDKILTSETNKYFYRYDGKRMILFLCGNDIWFHASNMAKILRYKNTRQAIIQHVDQRNKNPLSQFDQNKFTYNNAQPHTIFINLAGFNQLICYADKTVATVIAKRMGMDVYQKITRIETDITHELDMYCENVGIEGKPQYTPKNVEYRLDYYLPEYKLAIEIDEKGHKDRNPIHEKTREKILKKVLGCQFIRCNPDDPEFSIGKLFGQIGKHISDFN